MEEQRPIRPMSPSGPAPASGGEAAAQASKPPSLQTSDAGARSARVRSDLAREELETVKRTLRAVEAQANAADPATTPATAPSGDYIRTTFRRAAGGKTVAAWSVRSRVVEENGEQKTVWEVYSPLWSTGRTCAYAPGMAMGWNRLNVESGVLYAWLTWTGTKTGEAVAWTPGATQIGNSLADIPADSEPTETTSGRRTTVVQIGFFVTGQGGAKTFEQEHLGVIVEGAPGGSGGDALPDGAEAWGRVEVEEEKDGSTSSGGIVTAYNLYQHKQAWDAEQAKFVDKPGSRVLVATLPAGGDGGQTGPVYVPGPPELVETGTSYEPKPVERAYFHRLTIGSDGTPKLTKTSYVAWERDVLYHADDHVEGVL